jgi:hypothetical protein
MSRWISSGRSRIEVMNEGKRMLRREVERQGEGRRVKEGEGGGGRWRRDKGRKKTREVEYHTNNSPIHH